MSYANPHPASSALRSEPPGSLGLLLHHLQSPINIGMILRVAETYGVRVVIRGSGRVLSDPAKVGTISDFACGAMQRVGWQDSGETEELAALAQGRRLVATTVEPGCEALQDFDFGSDDMVLLGNEYDGLPEAVVNSCATKVRIPMANVWTPKPRSLSPIDPGRTDHVKRDGLPNLNVAMVAGIICYQWYVARLRARSRPT